LSPSFRKRSISFSTSGMDSFSDDVVFAITELFVLSSQNLQVSSPSQKKTSG